MSQLGNPPPSPSSQTSPLAGTKLVFVALGLAVAAVVAVQVYIAQIRHDIRGRTMTIYRLNVSVPVGARLEPRNLETVPIPFDFADAFPDAVTPEKLQNLQADRNTKFLRPARRGEVLSFTHFTRPTEGGDRLDEIISPGKVAKAIQLDSKKQPPLLRPGMWVDIAAPFVDKGRRDVMVVMERQKVIGVGQFTMDPENTEVSRRTTGGSFYNITIEVEPAEADQLSEIQDMAAGDFEVRVRNPTDDTRTLIPSGGINPAILEMLKNSGSGDAIRGGFRRGG